MNQYDQVRESEATSEKIYKGLSGRGGSSLGAARKESTINDKHQSTLSELHELRNRLQSFTINLIGVQPPQDPTGTDKQAEPNTIIDRFHSINSRSLVLIHEMMAMIVVMEERL